MNAKIISEIGINHNGDFEEAKKLIRESFFQVVMGLSFNTEIKIELIIRKMHMK